jgi:hypothetical protein
LRAALFASSRSPMQCVATGCIPLDYRVVAFPL